MRDYTSWVARMHQELQVEEGSWEPSSSLLRLRAHQWLRAELEAREELQQQATKLGQQALLVAGAPNKEVGIFPMLPAYPVLPWALFPTFTTPSPRPPGDLLVAPTPTSPSPRSPWGSISGSHPHCSFSKASLGIY